MNRVPKLPINIDNVIENQKHLKEKLEKIDKDELKIKTRKHRLLMNWARTNNLRELLSCPFELSRKDVNIIDKRKNTPLYYAAFNGNLKMCEFLCEKGARVNTVCSLGDTPFHMAFKSGSTQVKIFI